MTAKKAKQLLASAGDEDFIQHMLRRRGEIAAALRQSASRAQANQALADIFQAGDATQLGLLKALAKQQEVDAADVLLAMHELAPQKEVRKEARRALIQLAGSKIYPSWAPGSEQPTAIASSYPPRFWKGMVTLTRERGQAQVTLCWEYGFEYSEARLMSFLCDFWQDGVKYFMNETGAKRAIERRYQEQIARFQHDETDAVRVLACTLAEAKRVLLEALDVNTWRKTTPHKDYRHYLPTVQQLILNAPQVDEDGGRTFINADLEPDEVAGNFSGAWSLGDYGLCFDLLTDDSPLREGLERDEWIARRRAWADEAHPLHYESRVLLERAQTQGALWLPGAFLSDRAATRREVDLCWSLELAETPLSGTLPEMPLGTVVLRETGRHWFWTAFTLVKQADAWRIQRIADEGANAQGLPLVDLEKHLHEQTEAIQTIMDTHDPRSPEARHSLEEVIRRTQFALYFLDALLIKNPLDFHLYEEAAGYAISVGLRERSMVYLQKWAAHFPQHPHYVQILQQLGAIETLLASDYGTIGFEQRAQHFFELAERTLQEAISARPEPMSYLLLGELHIAQMDFDTAINYFQEGLAANPSPAEEAQIKYDMAGIHMHRAQPEAALNLYTQVEALTPGAKNLHFHMGFAYRRLNDASKAEEYLRRAAEEEPENAGAFVELCALYVDQRQLAAAIQVAEQGLRLHPDSADLHTLLASIYHEQGDRPRAEAELKEAERIDPTHQAARAVRSVFNEAPQRRGSKIDA
jgi:tetratricopeptide (TPR) repeat protein